MNSLVSRGIAALLQAGIAHTDLETSVSDPESTFPEMHLPADHEDAFIPQFQDGSGAGSDYGLFLPAAAAAAAITALIGVGVKVRSDQSAKKLLIMDTRRLQRTPYIQIHMERSLSQADAMRELLRGKLSSTDIMPDFNQTSLITHIQLIEVVCSLIRNEFRRKKDAQKIAAAYILNVLDGYADPSGYADSEQVMGAAEINKIAREMRRTPGLKLLSLAVKFGQWPKEYL